MATHGFKRKPTIEGDFLVRHNLHLTVANRVQDEEKTGTLLSQIKVKERPGSLNLAPSCIIKPSLKHLSRIVKMPVNNFKSNFSNFIITQGTKH